MNNLLSLASLGWQPFFQQQLHLDEWDNAIPARVLEHHKSEIEVASEAGRQSIQLTHLCPSLTVGDWILLDGEKRITRVLERKSCFRRKASGSKVSVQLIAANVDTAFIVCSLNDDFNLNRIERYLSLTHEAQVEPVIVLTKADLCPGADDLRNQVQQLDSLLCVEALNGLDHESSGVLLNWCTPGKTVVMLGSSGAGKSTLTNTLLGTPLQSTSGIREDDSKGRHTTTRRSLLVMPNDAMILDTPGMRELQLTDCEQGVAVTFADIEAVARQCRYGNCQHDSEPECAVKDAIESGELEERRLYSYRKLLREQEINSASLAERRANDKELSRYYARTQQQAKRIKRG
ncbi:ribosome small subunit-dependent GTPase A [Oceanicoccus sp. KOV_DT_Chl]|uniref:ribosome small subunit-dependent GTPase A n=1 Tax=Oceanicoccus sp. KOV_DT_Chl TaxID=1904639 RepID=UPI00190F025F|nr:ribosome small subunit-dependent GTPase A [Oceanicoccus sp. KOV_DT_Chl]